MLTPVTKSPNDSTTRSCKNKYNAYWYFLHHVKNALSFDEMQLQPDVKFPKRNIVNQRKLAQLITFSVRNMESEKWHNENID